MIICRTPFRISFFGGGTDYPTWYREREGAVLSSTINKYSYISTRLLPPFFDYKHRIRYFLKEEVQSLDEIKHPVVRECGKFLKIKDGLEITHNADLPARSGLGSSSTFTVGVLHSLYTLKNHIPTKRELALNAIHIEQNLINEAVGSQDQTAAAFGGLNYIAFNKEKIIEVQPVIIRPNRLKKLQDNLLLCFTGFSRDAPTIAAEQIRRIPETTDQLLQMTVYCREALNVLTRTGKNLDEFGELLNLQWEIKKSLSSEITNQAIDEIYELGRRNGAVGGKLLGAGGGGFILFYAQKRNHNKIMSALNKKKFIPFRFENTGSQIIYYTHD